MQSMVRASGQASRGQLSKATSVAVNNSLNVNASEPRAHLGPLAKVKKSPSGNFVILVATFVLIAQSFSPFLLRDGRQVCCPDPTKATSLFSKI
jgi:hypothetical protein